VSALDLGLKPAPAATPESPAEHADLDLRRLREQAEREAIVTALSRSNGNVLRAAEMLGVSRPTLYDLMHRLAIK
jgi:two-component system NtrC family response regulator